VIRRAFTTGRSGGFAYIAAVVFLVVLAGFALAALRLSTGSQATVNAQLLGARASQAARGGLEWALWQIKGAAGAATCTASVNNATLTDFAAASGMNVTLTCTVRAYKEGQRPDGSDFVKNIFELTATACPQVPGASPPSACPDNASVANADYVERRRSVSVCIAADGTDCY
jgi:MSHA biogenesis protein MshP